MKSSSAGAKAGAALKKGTKADDKGAKGDAPARRSARRRSRELALQGLYQWQVAKNDVVMIAAQLAEMEGYGRSDPEYLRDLLHGTIAGAAELQAAVAPCLSRGFEELSPVERGVLMIAAYELVHHPDVPYRVVINEAVELAKAYGGTDGYKFVNGVLDKLVPRLRPWEELRSKE